jgi:hypothetical protein
MLNLIVADKSITFGDYICVIVSSVVLAINVLFPAYIAYIIHNLHKHN